MSQPPMRNALRARNYPTGLQPRARTTRIRRHFFLMNRYRLTVLAFASLVASAFGQSRTVIIDPGHGGFDRGGVPGQRISEKDKCLDVGLRLRSILMASGYRVIMTRDSDVFIPLPTRVAIANAHPGASFVSIHFNCASRAGANGIETYYFRSDSANLAQSIHRNVVSGAPTENRGIRRRGFYVLRKTAIPSVLVECGFLTNPTEGSLALTANYRQTLAAQIARGIQRQPAASRPLTSSLRSVSLGGDFVRVPAENFGRSRKRSSKSSKSSHRSSKSSTKKKKKSSED